MCDVIRRTCPLRYGGCHYFSSVLPNMAHSSLRFVIYVQTSKYFLEGTTRLLSFLPIPPFRSVIFCTQHPPRLLLLLLHPTQRTTDQRPVAISR